VCGEIQFLGVGILFKLKNKINIKEKEPLVQK
jgi:hypothetical protein